MGMIVDGIWFNLAMMLLLNPLTMFCVLGIPLIIVWDAVKKRSKDKKKTKELIAKGADPKTFFVKGGIIYQKENKNCIKDKTR